MNVALSDLDGERNLARQRIGDGSATLELSRRRSEDETLNVQVTKLDTIADETFSKLNSLNAMWKGTNATFFWVASRQSNGTDR